MKFANRAVLFALLIGFISSCATGPTQTIKRAEEFSAAGITYSDTVVGLLDVTIERVITDDSDILIRQRKRLPADQLAIALNEQDTALVPLLKTIGSFRDSTRKLKAYFEALQGLTGTDVEKGAGAATGELVDTINAANQSIKKSGKVVFNNKEKEFISTLATLSAKSVRTNKIHASLERSSPIIGEQLLLHEKLLLRIKNILETAKLKTLSQEFKNQEVGLKNATERLKEDLQSLHHAIDVIRVISGGLGLITNIVGLLK